ncbi:MAG: hypothetical protein IPM79_22495 [Polyangiaceae bacterium]|nr:hypothetical protein [Polyangiaceae bacterium]
MVGPQISVGHYRIFHMIAVGLQVTMRGITGGAPAMHGCCGVKRKGGRGLSATTVVRLLLGVALAACGDDSVGGGGAGGAEGVSIQCEDQTCSFCCNLGECAADDSTCGFGVDEAGRTILKCDGNEDCDDGRVCCAGTPGGSFAFIAECQSASDCSSLPEPIFFCHDTDECGLSETCLPWELADYVNVCQ